MIILKIISFLAQLLWYILCIGILLAGLVIVILGCAFIIVVEVEQIRDVLNGHNL